MKALTKKIKDHPLTLIERGQAEHGANEKAAHLLHAICCLCQKPHPGFYSPRINEGQCTQGNSCACSFSGDGKQGRAHYGSIYDDDIFRPRTAQRERFAGLDPVCDTCLSQLVIQGDLDCVGSPVELGGHLPLPESDMSALKAARQYWTVIFGSIAERRGRQSTWIKPSDGQP
jgi:hypothetical protein